MFQLCHLPDKDFKFLLFDNKDFDLKELGLTFEGEIIEPNRIVSEYDEYPILNLNELLLKTLKPKERTVSHVLSEVGIETIYQLTHEKLLIDQKKSNLPRSKRDMILQRYQEIMKLCSEAPSV